jgi:hypothetical protein
MTPEQINELSEAVNAFTDHTQVVFEEAYQALMAAFAPMVNAYLAVLDAMAENERGE